jgi:uncharacterized protein with von Willebrand factor type A (vWA) domain
MTENDTICLDQPIKHRFIDYGYWGTSIRRHSLLEQFSFGWRGVEPNLTGFSRLYRDSITSIGMHSLIRQSLEKCPWIESDLFDETTTFFDQCHRDLMVLESPHEKERALLQAEKASDAHGFEFGKRWKALKAELKEKYPKRQLDLQFYEQQINESLKPDSEGHTKSVTVDGVRRNFIKRWERQLREQELAWKIEQIAVWREDFLKQLGCRLEQLLKLQEILGCVAGKLGRLWDLSEGSWSLSGLEDLKRYADLLERKKELLELADMLGRLATAEKEFEERTYKSTKVVQRWHTSKFGKSELTGVHESDDLSALLPHETALLSDPSTEGVFLKKFAEKKLQTFEFVSKEVEAVEEEVDKIEQVEKEDKRGPIIICIDTSGSMHGAPENVAKAMALALMKIAKKDDRACYMISFSTGIQTLELTNLADSLESLCRFLAHSFYGGTDAEPAFFQALEMLMEKHYEKADVVIASDFIMPSLSTATQNKVTKAQENGTRFHALAIGRSEQVAPVTSFDYVWNYEPHNPQALLRQIECVRKIPDPVKVEI